MAQLTGSGPGHGINYVMVDDEQRLFTTGSITSMPAISAAADPATTKIGDTGLGSASLIGAFDGVNVQSARIELGSYIIVAGSIASMPDVSVSAGSESWIKGGSIQTYSPLGSTFVLGSVYMTGSVVISSAPLIGVSGLKLDDLVGSVGVTVIVPGIGATNLGKQEDAVHNTGDVGVMVLGVRKDNTTTLVSVDGDYSPLQVNEDGILRTQAQQHRHIDECNATTGWSVLGNDTINLATTTNHTWGTLALEFDKVNSADDTIFAGIQKTLTSVDLNTYEKGGGFFLWNLYLSTIANISYAFLRIGTDNLNYNEFRSSVDDLGAGWNPIRMPLFHPTSVIGNGWNSEAITYISVGVAFSDEADTLEDIAIDHISINTGLQTSADITAQISSAVSSPNVIVRAWGNAVDTNAGNVSANTLRTVLSTDQARLAGSIVDMPRIGISGTDDIGSVVISSAPLIGVSGLIFTDGNMTGSMAMQGIGSVIISSSNLVGISGTIFDSGDITGSVVLSDVSSRIGVSGNINVSTGSIIVTDLRMPLFDLGSPGFKQLTQLVSGTHADVWTPGPGSKIEIHGYEISAHTAQMVRLNVSGETAITTINRFRLPNSGTAIRTFVHPITPGDADQTIGVGTTVAGSVDVTIYGRTKE